MPILTSLAGSQYRNFADREDVSLLILIQTVLVLNLIIAAITLTLVMKFRSFQDKIPEYILFVREKAM